MKTLSFLKKIITRGCVIFTFAITGIYLLGVSVDSGWIPTINIFFAVMAFSVILSAMNEFLFSDRLIFSIRLLIHFVVTAAVFYVVFGVWGGYKDNGGSMLSVFLIYTFAYIICAVGIIIWRYLMGEKENSEKKYENMIPEDTGKKETYSSHFSTKA